MRLAWRGLYLLGITLGVAFAWYIAEWVYFGRQPLVQEYSRLGIGDSPSRILPPVWLVAIICPITIISFCMMLVGTQDVIPKITFKKNAKTDKPI